MKPPTLRTLAQIALAGAAALGLASLLRRQHRAERQAERQGHGRRQD